MLKQDEDRHYHNTHAAHSRSVFFFNPQSWFRQTLNYIHAGQSANEADFNEVQVFDVGDKPQQRPRSRFKKKRRGKAWDADESTYVSFSSLHLTDSVASRQGGSARRILQEQLLHANLLLVRKKWKSSSLAR